MNETSGPNRGRRVLEADPHIIRTAAAGDHRAFEVIVRTYQEPVVREFEKARAGSLSH